MDSKFPSQIYQADTVCTEAGTKPQETVNKMSVAKEMT